MFGTANSIEPVQIAVQGARPRAADRSVPDHPPIREATAADARAAARRREADAKASTADPVRLAPSAKTGLFRRAAPEPAQPDAVSRRHGLYVAEKRGTRTYFADYQQKQEVMRADPKRISTKQDDRQTVAAMLDLAQQRGWARVRVRGTEDFKRETWVQAQVRGVAAEGYRPSQTDEQEVARRKAALAPAEGQGEPIGAPPVEGKAVSVAVKAPGAESAGKTAREVPRPGEIASPVAAAKPPGPFLSPEGQALAGRVTAREAAWAADPDLKAREQALQQVQADAAMIAGMTPQQRKVFDRAALTAAHKPIQPLAAAEVSDVRTRTKTQDVASMDAHAEKIAAMTPDQREAFYRQVHGKPVPQEDRAALRAEAAIPAKSVWGSVEEAGREARVAARAASGAEKPGERAKAEAA